MLLSFDQMKMLQAESDEAFKAKEDLTQEQRKELRELDEWYFEMYGKHLITNYKEL